MPYRVPAALARAPLVAVTLAAAAACSHQGPSLAGYEGLQRRVLSYYDGRATERGATCPNPRINTITNAEVVEDTPERVVMDIRYTWIDESQAVDVGENSLTLCRDRGERRFTFARGGAGGDLQVVGMSGPRAR